MHVYVHVYRYSIAKYGIVVGSGSGGQLCTCVSLCEIISLKALNVVMC